jgi:hypothetical protein
MFNLASIKVVKNVTLPLLKMKDDGTSYYVKIITEIYAGKDNKTGKQAEGDATQKVPDLIQVIDLETGEEKELIVFAVLKAELEEQYPEGSYKGRCFRLQKFAKADGKKYSTAQIAEIELTSEEEPTQAPVEVESISEAPAVASNHHKGKGKN